jgi:hypothetical protein
MTTASPPASSAASPSPDSPDVARLRRRFAELRRAESAARTRLLAVTVIVVLLFVGFAYTTLHRVQANFNQPALQKAVAQRLPHVMPPAGEQLQKAATNAMPTYRKLAAERFQQARPALAAKTRARLEKIPDETGHMMADALHTAFDGAQRRIEPDVKQAFPSLTDDQKRDLLTVYFHDAIAARDKDIAAHITTLYTKELVAMHNALANFELPRDDAASPTPDKAQRDFLHTLLVLADFELLNGDAPPPIPASPDARTARARTAATAPTTQAVSAQ